MPFCHQPISPWPCAADACLFPIEDPGAGIIAEAPAVYKPRHPERTGFYQLFETHFDNYVRAYEERFEARSGPLRPVVVRPVEDFLSCGRLDGGFARLRCSKCQAEHLLAFSCRQRGICGSCQAKRAALFAEKLTTGILAPVPHRHWTFSIPRVLRGLVERGRKLLGLLSQTAYASILKTFQALWNRTDVRPGCVVSLLTVHIPDPGQHTRRPYGAYCNRARVTAAAAQAKSDRAAQARFAGEDSEFARETRRTWARLLRKILKSTLCCAPAEPR